MMNAPHLESHVRRVRLGRRRLRLGHFKLEWGGAWYCVRAMSAAQIQDFKARAPELVSGASGSPEQLADAMLAGPLEIVRAMAPFFVNGPINPGHVARATPEELMALAQAVAEVNDFPALLLGFAEELSLIGPARWGAFSTSPAITGATTGAPKDN